jgi:hypothetical protein
MQDAEAFSPKPTVILPGYNKKNGYFFAASSNKR